MGMPQEPKAPLATPSRPAGTTRGSKPGLLPSRTWLRGARALWKILSRRERCLFVLGILVPALDQVSRLGSLGVTIRAVGYGIRQPLDLDKRLWLSLIILGATLVSVFIQMGASRVKRGLKAAISHLARRLYGQLMLAAAQHPPDERKALVAQLLAEEKGFHGSATTGTAALIEFLAATFLVLVLLGILAWFDWRVGLGLLCAMLGTLTLLRFRVKAASIKGVEGENEKLVEARKALSQKLEALGQRRSSPELLEDYVNNEYDALAQAEAEEKSRLQKRITSAMNFGSALLMALVFLFVSAEGAFDENKIVWMVVFVFGLRMAVSQSKTAMVKWGTMLAEKLTLMQMVRAGLVMRASERGAEMSDLEEEGEEQAGNDYGTLARIVEYSFCGLNGPEIISREPLVVEMCVEAREVLEGVSWSFAISNLEGTSFLITKTTSDQGLTWDIPKGRSWFRVVTGPVWLHAGTFSGWIGFAKGSQTLDLIGSQTDPVLLHVLPDETVKQVVSTREIRDVVAMDVEWDLDFKHEAQSPPVAQAAPSATTNNS